MCGQSEPSRVPRWALPVAALGAGALGGSAAGVATETWIPAVVIGGLVAFGVILAFVFLVLAAVMDGAYPRFERSQRGLRLKFEKVGPTAPGRNSNG